MSARDKLAPHIRDKDPFELCLVGGNHLANILIGQLGPGFHEEFPPNDFERARGRLSPVNYDVWCCWSLMMIARDIRDEEQSV